jgi:hypothetical protein
MFQFVNMFLCGLITLLFMRVVGRNDTGRRVDAIILGIAFGLAVILPVLK